MRILFEQQSTINKFDKFNKSNNEYNIIKICIICPQVSTCSTGIQLVLFWTMISRTIFGRLVPIFCFGFEKKMNVISWADPLGVNYFIYQTDTRVNILTHITLQHVGFLELNGLGMYLKRKSMSIRRKTRILVTYFYTLLGQLLILYFWLIFNSNNNNNIFWTLQDNV